jgi:hypothetical protein
MFTMLPPIRIARDWARRGGSLTDVAHSSVGVAFDYR